MSEKSKVPYRVHDQLTGDVSYVRASSRSQARNIHMFDRLDVRPLTVEEALKLTPEEVAKMDARSAAGEIA